MQCPTLLYSFPEKGNKTTRKITPMTMMMKNRKTIPMTRYVQCSVSLRLSSHTRDQAAKAIATKPSLAVVDLLYNVLLGEAIQAVPRREPW